MVFARPIVHGTRAMLSSGLQGRLLFVGAGLALSAVLVLVCFRLDAVCNFAQPGFVANVGDPWVPLLLADVVGTVGQM